MNPTHEEALFALVLAKPVERRAEFLEKVCESDASLRARLEALLAAHDGTGVIPAADSVSEELTPTLELAEPVADEAVGQTLGRYKLLERVGEGGCGVVYVAEQTEPVRRRVALKVIKLGMDTKQVVARFEAERQALAMMDHPNIAKVLDAGTTDTGRPYFVMELVREMAFSPDGRWLASASSDQTVRLWDTSGDANRWTEARILRGHGDEVVAVAFSPDGRFLASASRDGDVLLWGTVADQKSNYGYQLLPGDVRYLDEISPGIALANGPRYSSPDLGMRSGRRFLLRLEDMSELPTPFGFDFDTPYAHFHPNHFVSYEKTNVLRVLDLEDGWLQRFREEVGPGVEGFALFALSTRVGAAPKHFSEPRLFAWSETSGAVQLADLGPSKRRWRWSSALRTPIPMEFSSDGRQLLLLGYLNRESRTAWAEGWELREAATGNLLLKSELPTSQLGPRFVDNGQKLVAVAKMGDEVQMLFWNLTRPSEPPAAFPLSVGPTGARGLEHPDVSPDGRWVSLIGRAGEVALYDAAIVARTGALKVAVQSSFSTCFSPDSQRLVTGAGGGAGKAAVQLWQVDTGQELVTLPGRPGAVTTILFGEDGNTLLAGLQAANSWQMWRAPSWEYIHAAEANEKR